MNENETRVVQNRVSMKGIRKGHVRGCQGGSEDKGFNSTLPVINLGVIFTSGHPYLRPIDWGLSRRVQYRGGRVLILPRNVRMRSLSEER